MKIFAKFSLLCLATLTLAKIKILNPESLIGQATDGSGLVEAGMGNFGHI